MLRHFSVSELNKICKTQEIWCYGCGKRFNELIDLYKDEDFTKKITAIIDKNSNLWGIKKVVVKKDLYISSPNLLLKNNIKESPLLLLTTDRSEEIYQEWEPVLKQKKIICSQYPEFYHSYIRFVFNLVKMFPLKKQILFKRTEMEPHENIDSIIEYLENSYQGYPYQLIALVENKKEMQYKKGIKYLTEDSLKKKSNFWNVLKFCFLYGSSKFLLYENEPLKKIRKDQILIFLNHGFLPLKNVRDVLKQPPSVDFAVCPSKACADIYEKQYGIPKAKLIYSIHPRVSKLFSETSKLKKLIKYNDKQVIIWLPTFRALKGTDRIDSSDSNPLSILKNEEILTYLNSTLERNNQLLVIKPHPREKLSIDISKKLNSILVLTEADLQKINATIHELLNETTALLTDYSSIAFDYMLLNKPIGYVLTDIFNYSKGFSVKNPLDYMPGTKIYKFEDLMTFLTSLSKKEDLYIFERNELIKSLFNQLSPKDGAKNVVNFLEGI